MESKTRAELKLELAKLRKQHYDAIYKATFRGFTPNEEAQYEERTKRIASLAQQIEGPRPS